MCAGVPGFERANHLSARKEFHTAALEVIESDCEHEGHFSVCADKRTVNLREYIFFILLF